MAFEHYISAGNKKLRMGYTTGTCAALAAKGAMTRLLTGVWPKTVALRTPKGLVVEVPLENCNADATTATCGVRKDGGDDMDQTTGALIMATVSLLEESENVIHIEGGQGVGRVTRPGLDQPVGNAAINHVPREMITEAVQNVCQVADYSGGVSVTISVPEGVEIAQHTFNPNLGIEGGISILGTSGIVEPMSMQALIDTLTIELRQKQAEGATRLILTPGNYGMDFLSKQGLITCGVPVVKMSNFVGNALDACTDQLEEVLLVGHIGKFVKLAAGIMNTHSKYADCRTELFVTHAALCGADTALCKALKDCATTDACLELLYKESQSLTENVITSLLTDMQKHVERRAAGKYSTGILLFSNVYGELGRSPEAKEILAKWYIS